MVRAITLAHGKLVLNEVRLPWLSEGAGIMLGTDKIQAKISDGIARFSSPVTLKADGPELVFTGKD